MQSVISFVSWSRKRLHSVCGRYGEFVEERKGVHWCRCDRTKNARTHPSNTHKTCGVCVCVCVNVKVVRASSLALPIVRTRSDCMEHVRWQLFDNLNRIYDHRFNVRLLFIAAVSNIVRREHTRTRTHALNAHIPISLSINLFHAVVMGQQPFQESRWLLDILWHIVGLRSVSARDKQLASMKYTDCVRDKLNFGCAFKWKIGTTLWPTWRTQLTDALHSIDLALTTVTLIRTSIRLFWGEHSRSTRSNFIRWLTVWYFDGICMWHECCVSAHWWFSRSIA